ncbi:MAG: tRNA uridine-5-carboxymethylaminomethyl(34) synthesis GTPase MnmE [Chlorobi bacterium]|nr:tRNA uridine-5-carboxymethylaminomethyl(34) synthesis GTPase MnmE [Chlorobiota bacterium]
MIDDTTITAISTPAGSGAISIIRLSGKKSISIIDSVFTGIKNVKISKQKANTIHLGVIKDKENIIDEVLVSIFKNPNSYTGEDLIEVSCHGSIYIQQEILKLFITKGAVLAQPGEFTMRAFLNGKLDLSQAEAVADLISSSSAAMHKLAMNQMRGGFSTEIKNLRQKLLKLISLIELELDFSEEDVEFADRNELKNLLASIQKMVSRLVKSFDAGNAIKNGIPITIAGKTNVGKSTLLNVLLNEEKAIVSDIAGTTRDIIEDTINLNGVSFRFIDTAGLRDTTDTIESIGIERTIQKIEQANIVLFMVDAEEEKEEIRNDLNRLSNKIIDRDKKIILLINKIDKLQSYELNYKFSDVWKKSLPQNISVSLISASKNTGIDILIQKLLKIANINSIANQDVVITNMRHYEALVKINEGINRVFEGLESGLSSDFLAMDIRDILHYLGEITGEITTDEILGNIFENFCIGK